MAVTSRFTAAVHALLAIAYYTDKNNTINNEKTSKNINSVFLAESTNANPVIMRNILSSLKKAGIISIKTGVGDAKIIKPYNEITLLDIYEALQAGEADFFKFYPIDEGECPVANGLHTVLDPYLDEVRGAMRQKMSQINLQMLYKDILKIHEK